MSDLQYLLTMMTKDFWSFMAVTFFILLTGSILINIVKNFRLIEFKGDSKKDTEKKDFNPYEMIVDAWEKRKGNQK